MAAITADELSHQTEDVLRRVRDDGETIEIVEGGAVVARLVPAAPVAQAPGERSELDAMWEEIGRWAAEQDARWRLAEGNPEQMVSSSVEERPLTPKEKAELDAWWEEMNRLAIEI